MEFELWYLILVPVLFCAGWMARSFDLKEKKDLVDEKQTLYKGVDLLLSNKPEQAVDSFVNLVRADPDTVEMHFALASLFRRRGEFDRAIRIHNHLLNREDLPKSVRSRALFSLGRDYLKAGVWDRAEEAFKKLADTSDSYKIQAQKELLHIYETEKEWRKAIDAANMLQRQTGENYGPRIAQLFCELAAFSLYRKDFKGAAECIEGALSVDAQNKRALIMKGDLLNAKGDVREAVNTWKMVGQVSPAFETLVVEKIVTALMQAGEQDAALRYVLTVFERANNNDELAEVALLLSKVGNPQGAIDILQEKLKKNPNLIGFQRLLDLRLQEQPDNESLKQLNALLKELLNKMVRYKCAKCGFATRKFMWRCPGCHNWESFPPVKEENLSGRTRPLDY